MTILGLDMSKSTFDATLIDDTTTHHHRQFANTPEGFVRLDTWVTAHSSSPCHACMEATNVYWEALAEDLFGRGYQVSVANPAQTKGFALSQLKRAKTDKVDSGVIAEFCARMSPRLWTPPRPEQRHLRDLVRHLASLKQLETQQQNRLKTCRDEAVQQSLNAILDTVKAQQTSMLAQIEAVMTTYPTFEQQRAFLLSIPGIGKTTAAIILAELPDLAAYENARTVAADVGVTPAPYESGTSVRRRSRLSKLGNASVRSALYWPAITAMQHNPIVRDLAERLERKGKPKKVIIGAAMRKLVHLAYGVLKHQTMFDPTYGQPQETIMPQPVCQ